MDNGEKVTKGERAILQSLAMLGELIVCQSRLLQRSEGREQVLEVMKSHVRFMDQIFEASFDRDDNGY